MIQTKVIIHRKSDLGEALKFSSPPPFGDLAHVVIMEGGMASGESSVAFHIIMPDGSSVMCQTSALIFHGIRDALHGAELFFRAYPEADGSDIVAPEGFEIPDREKVNNSLTKGCPNDPGREGSCMHCVKMVGGCPHRK